jgi:uncharacterized protein DUF6399
MSAVDASVSSQESQPPRWDRAEAAATLAAYEQRPPWQSQRDFAREADVPRSTLQHWQARKDGLDADPLVAGFLEAPQGVAFIHRLVVAAHFTFNQVGPGGVRLMSLFLRLSRLDCVVAASKTAQHDVAVAMEGLIEQFGRTQRQRLAATMAPKRIGLCEDETFHRGQMCLVGMEPLSGFVLLEMHSKLRDEPTWTEAMKAAVAGLKVEIEHLVSDEARGLRAHARDGLGVHHGPDLFHGQQDLGKATSTALEGRVNRAAEGLSEAREKVQARLDEQAAYWSVPHGPGRPPAFEQRIAEAHAVEQQAEQALREAEGVRSEVKDARHAISELYHPFDLQSGQSRSAEALQSGLEEQFGRIESAAAAAGLSQASHKLIAKARRLLPSMVATMAFFFARMRLALDAVELEPALEALVREKLIPALYLQRVAEQAPAAERKAELRRKAQEVLAQASSADSPLQALPEQQRRCIEHTARRCAEMFVRSSSCVEGRNGQLALRHHSLHRLSDRKLAVLTTIHNYFLRRADGTTAAERFFGSKPQDLFEWILDCIDLPARPAKQRPRKLPKLL